jgi:ABC-type microcin C transport system duplicated ATPase subunit YejF
MDAPLLQVENLSVSFQTDEGRVDAVRDVSFDIRPGEVVGLVGESGSGKSVAALSCLRLIPMPPGQILGGRALFAGRDLLRLPIEELRKIRGSEIGVIFQEPMTALSPLAPVGWQLAETVRLHQPGVRFEEAWKIGVDWLEKVGIPDASNRAHAFPYQFSGGMRQRVMIAMALMLEPRLIIADEPTTALDVTLQAQIFDLILAMKQENTSILFITHDMGVIWELSDRVMVMKDGQVVERGPVDTIFHAPSQPYTQALLRAVPRLDAPPPPRREELPAQKPLIQVRNLRTWFPVRRGVFARVVSHVKAVDEVSLEIYPGETLGIVGESGSGKTTLGRSILRLDAAREGAVLFDGEDLLKMTNRELRPRRRHLQMVFQDPFSSLNPRFTVEEIVTEGLVEHGLLEGESTRDAAVRWLEEVGLQADYVDRYPHEFSGGQRQRICIARAIAVRPRFIVCDEAVSALDVTIQAKVIDLLIDLRQRHGLSYLFISHDLAVVKKISDRVVVMKGGRIVEQGPVDALIAQPQEEYTRRLIDAVPVPGGVRKRRS